MHMEIIKIFDIFCAAGNILSSWLGKNSKMQSIFHHMTILMRKVVNLKISLFFLQKRINVNRKFKN